MIYYVPDLVVGERHRPTLNSPSSCFSLLRAGITGVQHHIGLSEILRNYWFTPK